MVSSFPASINYPNNLFDRRSQQELNMWAYDASTWMVEVSRVSVSGISSPLNNREKNSKNTHIYIYIHTVYTHMIQSGEACVCHPNWLMVHVFSFWGVSENLVKHEHAFLRSENSCFWWWQKWKSPVSFWFLNSASASQPYSLRMP